MIYIVIYSFVMISLVAIVELRRRVSNSQFLVANRQIGGLWGAMSVASSWIWAPALFVSTQVGYVWGYSGLFWFILPNIFALMLFGPFAQLVRDRFPEGFSYLGYIRDQDRLYFLSQASVHFLVQIVAFAIQLTAGAELLSVVSGTDYFLIVVVMTVAPLLYSMISGISASILTDVVQYIIIICSIAFIYYWFPFTSDIQTLTLAEFDPFDKFMLMQFGIASALTLTFGIFADHQQWQRAFSIKHESVSKTFILSGLFHGIVTFSLGTLGVLLKEGSYVAQNVHVVGAEFISAQMPYICTVVFVFMALCGLCSTIDSALCAFGSLYSTEISKSENFIKTSRQAMFVLSLLGFILGVCRVPVITLWLFVGILRLSSISSTIASIFSSNFSGRAGALSIFLGILLGGPLFAYGAISGDNDLRTVGIIYCIVASLLAYIMASPIKNVSIRRRKVQKQWS